MRVAEREFVQIARQMLFAAMLVDALHAALEHGEEILDRLRMHVAARPFFFRMVDALMRRELAAGPLIRAPLVRHQLAFLSACFFSARRGSAEVAPLIGIARARPPRSTSAKTASS